MKKLVFLLVLMPTLVFAQDATPAPEERPANARELSDEVGRALNVLSTVNIRALDAEVMSTAFTRLLAVKATLLKHAEEDEKLKNKLLALEARGMATVLAPGAQTAPTPSE